MKYIKLTYPNYFSVLLPLTQQENKRKTTMKWKTCDPEYNEQVQGDNCRAATKDVQGGGG